jgi:hypothetical protein
MANSRKKNVDVAKAQEAWDRFFAAQSEWKSVTPCEEWDAAENRSFLAYSDLRRALKLYKGPPEEVVLAAARSVLGVTAEPSSPPNRAKLPSKTANRAELLRRQPARITASPRSTPNKAVAVSGLSAAVHPGSASGAEVDHILAAGPAAARTGRRI